MGAIQHSSQLMDLPFEVREKIWDAVFEGVSPWFDWNNENNLHLYTVGLLQTSQAVRKEALLALRKHFSQTQLSYYEGTVPVETDEDTIDDDDYEDAADAEALRRHIRFLNQYGDCFKNVSCVTQGDGDIDPFGLGRFPNLKILKLETAFEIHLETEDDVMVDGVIDTGLLDKAWRDIDEDELTEGVDPEEYLKIFRMVKGKDRSFSVYVNLDVYIDSVELMSVNYDIDEKEIIRCKWAKKTN